ncbi:nicotinate phosphoribosyltransferase [Obba rivulosa]|uniref:Nicotinate phosphoribosyltransferase n=1 Tax=Obba rivulosa TaxID=1052685 RepID=A0A8E2DSA8_9APHY|nr:nicotinate phosphoribosyltransferase [Obba rivulosa]
MTRQGELLGFPASLLDSDLYKFTMQQAVLRHFPDVSATYRFTHRDKGRYFSRECYERFRESVSHFDRLQLTKEERDWLAIAYPQFRPDYLDYLYSYRFKPDQVHIQFIPVSEDGQYGNLDIEAVGLWVETILWEVPLMACLSETYFCTVDTDWDYEGQSEQAYEKGRTLLNAGCVFSEFGTRRRRSYHTQDLVVEALVRASKEMQGSGKLLGTSNVHLAHKYNISPIGTVAHEWYMAVGAIMGYEHVNHLALKLWEDVYSDGMLLALTDTFSTQAFFKEFLQHPEQARRWNGLRQDSGDPFVYAPFAREIYRQLDIDHTEKTIIYSDAVDVDKALKLHEQCRGYGFKCSFGIGTSFTNDFKSVSSGRKGKSKALNIVIKLASVNGKPTVKISDELSKNTGDPETVKLVKEIFELPSE